MEQSAWRIAVGISRLTLLAMPYANITHYSIIPTFHHSMCPPVRQGTSGQGWDKSNSNKRRTLNSTKRRRFSLNFRISKTLPFSK
jgi:hypothetical protein